MGDAQSAQREGKKDAAAEEESGKVDDALTEQAVEDKPLKNTEQISEIIGKADGSIAEVNGHCKDEIAAEAILTPDEDVSETEKPLQEEVKPLENDEIKKINEKTSPDDADANEDVPLEMTEMDAKQNDINDGFRRFFSNIGLKLTVKRGSVDTATDVPDKTNNEEPSIPEEVEDAAKESKSENAEQNTDVNRAQETYDNDSTTCPTMTDATSEDAVENAEEKTTETKEEVESHDADTATPSAGEDAHQEATPEEEPHETSLSGADVDAVSPIKRFFTTGIFSGLGKKKKKAAEDETTEKELVDMGKKEVIETTEQTVEDRQQDKEEFSSGVEAAAVEAEHKEAQMTDESEMSPQEKEKVPSSPLKRLLSGSSFKKLSKKQRSRRSSDAKLSDSGEHVSDQLLSSTESAENQKQEGPAQPSAEAGEEDGAWASFKKLMTPKKRVKRPSLTNEETQISGPVEPKPSEGEQISDHSTEEGKKRKDSSVSWEAVLCGSGRRRSRKTSDSEDETPQIDNTDHKQGGGSKHGAESPLESSNEPDIVASSPKQAGSPSESDGGSTWNSLKRLVTPKRKAKDEDESKDIIQSDSEVTQDESSFSLKKLLPGRKKRKSAEKQDRASSDEADRDVASGDEDSETPAVVPMSEFDTVETEVHIQTQAEIESPIPEEANYELQKDLLDQIAEPVLPCESLQTEANKVQDNYAALEKQVPTTPTAKAEPDDETESTSSHQQLSDIPEEGIITDTMVTPASVAEEAARDDTLAEDLIEITSEAITAPEPASGITLADETEMISAVSQLSSESSKTSGNTTPVPAEYEVVETDELLYQVVETISISPKSIPVCSDEPSSEQIVGSASHQILEKFEIEEPTILEIHRRLDATAINTGLNVEELDAINELAATSQTESTSEVVSEVPTEEFYTAEIPVDKKQEVGVSHPEESVEEFEQIDESHHLVKGLSEINAAVPIDKLPEGEETVLDVGSVVEAHQAETEDSAATVADEMEGTMEQEVQMVTEKEDQIQVEDTDQPPVEVGELRELAAVQGDILDSEEGSVRSPEVISEDILAAKTVTDELKEETEPEKEDEQEQDAAKTEQGHIPEELGALDSEETSVQSPEEEVKSEDSPPAETVTDKPKQTAEHLTEVSVEPENKELPVNVVRTEHVQEPEVLEAVQEPIFDSVDGSVQSLEKEAIVDLPKAETVTYEPKHETIPLTEPVDASKTDHVQEPEVLQAVPAPTSEAALEKEVTSEEVPGVETVADESKQETDVKVEPEEKLPVEVAKTEHIEEPQVLETVQAFTLVSEDSSVKSLEKEVISAVPEAETVTDGPKHEEIPLTEPVDVSKIEDVQEPEVLQAVRTPTSEAGSLLSLEKEETSEDIPAEETVTDEPKQETEVEVEPEEKVTLEAAKTEEQEVLPSDVKDIVTETKEVVLKYAHIVKESFKGGISEDIPKPDTDNLIASVADEIKSKVLPQLGQALEKTEDQKTESITHDVRVKQEDSIPEVEDELQTLTAVHVSSVNEEASNVQETAALCVENSAVTDEPKHAMQLSEVLESVEQEKERKIPDSEIKTAVVERTLVASVVVCDVKDVSVAEPDVLIEKTSEMTEPLIETVANEVVLKEEVEAAVPFVKEDTAETTGEIEMMHVPSVTLEEQVQVVDVDLKSAGTMDSVLEGGLTDTKEVIDVCNEMGKKVDNLSATPEIEQELINEEHKVTIQEVIQHVEEELPETASESVVVNFKQEVIQQPDAVTKVSEVVESESNDVEENTESSRERQDGATAVISDDSATEQQVSKDLMQTPDLPESLDISIRDHKEDLEQTKAEQEKLRVGITAEEVRSSSQEILEQAQITQMSQSTIVTPSNTGLVIPQNTGIISSVGNVESPSSLSLEFKLNIQFGQAKAPFSPPPVTERIAPVIHTDIPEVGVQAANAEEPVKPINPTQRPESQKQELAELASVTVQARDITEAMANLDSRENGVIMPQPVLQDVGIQVMETVEPVEQIESTETVTSSVQATETIHPIRPTEQREVFVSHAVLCKAHDQDTKVEEPVKKIEEENDQDEWMDAEEVIYTQEKTEMLLEVKEPLEPQTGSEQEEEAGLGREAPDSKTAEEESQQEMHKTEGPLEIESDGEDFAVALEDLESSSVSVTTMDFD